MYYIKETYIQGRQSILTVAFSCFVSPSVPYLPLYPKKKANSQTYQPLMTNPYNVPPSGSSLFARAAEGVTVVLARLMALLILAAVEKRCRPRARGSAEQQAITRRRTNQEESPSIIPSLLFPWLVMLCCLQNATTFLA